MNAALIQGGLHHDAAIVYLNKLQDALAAARAFEAAGEIDRAVQLYRQRGDHLAAADLMRRTGEEEAALAEYTLAAEKLIAKGHGHLAAGELMLHKAGRADLAQPYFETGWLLRPEANATACALHLARLYAEQETPARLLALASEGEEFLAPPGHDVEASQFYNEIARLADRPNLAGVRDDLRDRCLLGLATKLRQQVEVEARAGTLVSGMLGQVRTWAPAPVSMFPKGAHPWAPPVVSDADFAVKAALKRPTRPPADEPVARPATRLRAGDGTVTAACHAPASGDIFLGFKSGEVVYVSSAQGKVIRCPICESAVTSLAVDREGKLLVALHESAEGGPERYLVSYSGRERDGSYRRVERRFVGGSGPLWLTPLVGKQFDEHVLGLWDGEELTWLRGLHLMPEGSPPLPFAKPDLTAALLLPSFVPNRADHALLVFDAESLWCYASPWWNGLHRVRLSWRPVRRPQSTLESLPLAWLQGEREHLELAGLGAEGTLYWSALRFGDGVLDVVSTNVSVCADGYLAVALVQPGLVAGVARSRIDWLRGGAKNFSLWATTKVELNAAVACFPSHATNELIVVCADGWVERVGVPN
jgi:hypothetical protein